VGNESFLGINVWTALFTLLNTLTLFFVLKTFLFGPVMKMIEDRQKEIDDLYSDAERSRTEAAALETEYRGKLTVAAETGERMVQEAVQRGRKREEEIIRQANAEAEAIHAKASADIALEKKKAVSEAKTEISKIALEIAEKVVGRALTDSDQADLVDGFIDSLGDQS
jgi:F-type H+-transporting ATPase subunit b